jgi:muramoyltetrapeptide carboxypeptidase
MKNLSWSALKRGDIVEVVAPGSFPANIQVEDYIFQIRQLVSSLGLVARFDDSIITKGADLFSAHNVNYRAHSFINALNSGDSKAIWCLRGGYGSAEIIPFLNEIDIPKQTKLLLGFSDITALHLFLQVKWHWSSIHSPVLNQLLHNQELKNQMMPILFGKTTSLVYTNLQALNKIAKKNMEIRSKIIGGNLSLIQTSLSTCWQINASDKIIFIEEVSERGYKIERMLNHLLQAGVFNSAKALIFGDVVPELEPNGEDLCFLAISQFAENLSIPVLYLPGVGHDLKSNSPLPLGTNVILHTGEELRMLCEVNN